MLSTLLKPNFNVSVIFILSSANAFNLDQSKILSFGKEMMLVTPLNSGLINMQPNVTTGAHLVNTLTFVTNCKLLSILYQ